MELVDRIKLGAWIRGVSIDFQGYIWAVEFGGKQAFRVNKRSKSFEVFDDLVGAYTYSDMTGFALMSTVHSVD